MESSGDQGHRGRGKRELVTSTGIDLPQTHSALLPQQVEAFATGADMLAFLVFVVVVMEVVWWFDNGANGRPRMCCKRCGRRWDILDSVSKFGSTSTGVS